MCIRDRLIPSCQWVLDRRGEPSENWRNECLPDASPRYLQAGASLSPQIPSESNIHAVTLKFLQKTCFNRSQSRLGDKSTLIPSIFSPERDCVSTKASTSTIFIFLARYLGFGIFGILSPKGSHIYFQRKKHKKTSWRVRQGAKFHCLIS